MLQGISCVIGKRFHVGRAMLRHSFLSTGLHDFPQFISKFFPEDAIKNSIDTVV